MRGRSEIFLPPLYGEGQIAKRSGWGMVKFGIRRGIFKLPHPGLRPTLPKKGREAP
jgi:hypothetical protein